MYRLITTILLGVAFAATITAAPASPRHWRPTLADLDRVSSGLRDGLPGDLISQDLRSVLFHLAEITGGAITSDEVLHSVFKSFCIGK